LVTEHRGQFPTSLAALEKLPGIGRSTAGAILSLGLGIRAPILDGNVRRVLARHGAIEGWPGQAETLRKLWDLSESLTPEFRVADFNQAMMDLGSLICTPRGPTCDACPLKTTCLSYQEGTQLLYPGRRPGRAIPVRNAFWLILRKPSGEIYLEQRPERGIWGGLLSPPEFETREALEDFCLTHFGSGCSSVFLPQRRHTFSHFHLDFLPLLSDIDGDANVPVALSGRFLAPDQVGHLPTPVRKLLGDLSLQTRGSTP
jgi:A/G-specific adenine glycosylase